MNKEIEEAINNIVFAKQQDYAINMKKDIDKLKDYINKLEKENQELKEMIYNHTEFIADKTEIILYGGADKTDKEFTIYENVLKALGVDE